MNNKILLLGLEDRVSSGAGMEWQLEASGDEQTIYQIGRVDDGSGGKVVVDKGYISIDQGNFIYSSGLWKYQDTGTNKPKLISKTGIDRSNILAKGSPVVIFNGDSLRFGEKSELILHITIPKD